MTREKLIDALGSAAQRCGYEFYTGFEYQTGGEVGKFPVLWLLPPELIKIEGRNEGLKHYQAKVNLLDLRDEQTEQANRQKRGEMEEAASRICVMLASEDCVQNVSDIQCGTPEKILTSYGEISVSLSFKVQMPFCVCDHCGG